MNAESQRLQEARDSKAPRKKWGPSLSERQWGTVREDYSDHGNAWEYFSHDHARSRAYHWGEDGLAGICDERQQLCFALALSNGKDPIIKERLFGLTNSEGNHGEDVKECYFYLDSTPTHSYMKFLYKYPQAVYPYDDPVKTNRGRDRHESEYELMDTGVFDQDRYFDVLVEYAKESPEDILVQISIHNRGPEPQDHRLRNQSVGNTWISAGPLLTCIDRKAGVIPGRRTRSGRPAGKPISKRPAQPENYDPTQSPRYPLALLNQHPRLVRFFGLVAPSRALRRTENPRVGGSIPPLAMIASLVCEDDRWINAQRSKSRVAWPSSRFNCQELPSLRGR